MPKWGSTEEDDPEKEFKKAKWCDKCDNIIKLIKENPYELYENITCEACNEFINADDGFYHCATCLSD